MEAVSKLELTGIVYPPCGPGTFGNAMPQAAALGPGAGGADAAQLAAMQQVRAHAGMCRLPINNLLNNCKGAIKLGCQYWAAEQQQSPALAQQIPAWTAQY
jgi:hypothetical protein